ncbi:MAG: ATPase, partial [Elusimicrobia bacterium CG_4_10_14_0_2_um_filter_56_8]
SVPAAGKAVSMEQVLTARQTADLIYVDDKIKNYVLDLVIATREPEKHGLDKIKPWIKYGASPRATIYMIQAAKAYAFINGRGYVTPEDIKAVGFDIMRHRILLTYEAEAENIGAEDIIKSIFEAVEVP